MQTQYHILVSKPRSEQIHFVDQSKDVFAYSWKQHRAKSVRQELDEMRSSRDLSETDWLSRVHVISKTGAEVPTANLDSLAEEAFPLDVFVDVLRLVDHSILQLMVPHSYFMRSLMELP